jgi:regulator of RNase E activity RraB
MTTRTINLTETTTIERDGWGGFFDLLTADHKGENAAIELVDPAERYVPFGRDA